MRGGVRVGGRQAGRDRRKQAYRDCQKCVCVCWGGGGQRE